MVSDLQKGILFKFQKAQERRRRIKLKVQMKITKTKDKYFLSNLWFL
jgi:hypothetical protein